MLFDTDFGFGNITSRYNHETLPFATQAYHNNWPNPAWSTTLFRKLLNNPEFKKQFINTFADQLNTSFQPERVEDLINSIYKEVKNDLFDHYKRWNTPFINNNILIDFGNNRPNFLYNHINDFFKLAGTAQVTLKTNESDEDNMGHIRINSIDITSDYPGLENDLYFTGKYYKNNEITITAVPNPGYKFISWEGTNNTSSTLKVNLTNDIILRAIFIEDMDYVIDFYDPNLKRSLSTLLNKDEITVRNMLFIKELDLSNMNISNIEGLQYAINLTHLDLSNNNITDLKPIQNLKSIQTLNLGSNIYLSSLDTLSNLNTIEDLNLSNVYLGNKINLLANFQKLNRLNLRNTGISDISVLIPIIEAGAFQDRNSLDLRENEIQNYYLINNYYPNPPVPIEEFTNNPYVIDILITIPTILLSIFTIIITRKIYKNNRT
jgi:Leucine-rich repeat (LRR) protein